MKKTIAGIRALFGRKGKAAAGALIISVGAVLLVKYAGVDEAVANDLAEKTFYLALAYMGATGLEDFAKHLRGGGDEEGGSDSGGGS